MVKVHSKAQVEFSVVPSPKMDELYAMLNGLTVYSSLDCTSGYHHIALFPEAKRKSVFITTIGKIEFRKVTFGLVQSSAHFQ